MTELNRETRGEEIYPGTGRRRAITAAMVTAAMLSAQAAFAGYAGTGYAHAQVAPPLGECPTCPPSPAPPPCPVCPPAPSPPPLNTAPVSQNDLYAVMEDGRLDVPAPGTLGNDTDAEDDALTARLVSGPANGTLTYNTDGSFVYTPRANFFGQDSFTYRANDGTADGNIATVTITVTAVNDSPIARGDAYSVKKKTLTVGKPGVLRNDSDPDSDRLSARLVQRTKNGKLALSSDGSFIYKPKRNFKGTDSFTYRAYDGKAFSTVVRVTIKVRATRR